MMLPIFPKGFRCETFKVESPNQKWSTFGTQFFSSLTEENIEYKNEAFNVYGKQRSKVMRSN